MFLMIFILITHSVKKKIKNIKIFVDVRNNLCYNNAGISKIHITFSSLGKE
jgi:hypothetical protein